MRDDLFCRPAKGTCVFCLSEDERVVSPSLHRKSDPPGLVREPGVCDSCSYTLARFWRRARGERVEAVTPRVIRTYALVPRLKKGRAEEDLSGYDFLVDEDGRLPSLDGSAVDRDRLAGWLADAHGVVTWPATTRPCYLGYDASADMSEVVLVWAWGKIPLERGQRFASLDDLLAEATPEAGFYLGVKQAFEAMLARRELSPGDFHTCLVLRQPAVRYLATRGYCPGGGEDVDDDADMLEIYRAAMSADELEVARLLAAAAARAGAEEEPARAAPVKREEEVGAVEEEEVAEGYARPVRPPGGGDE